MGRLKMDYDGMASHQSQLNTFKETITDLGSSLSSEVNSLISNGYVEGKFTSDLQSATFDIVSDASELSYDLGQYANFIGNTAESRKNVEKKSAQGFINLGEQ